MKEGVVEPAETKPSIRHFSLIRDFTVADFITLANASSGMGSVLAVMQHLVTGESKYLWVAFALLPFALVFDYLDGRIARWRCMSSLLGTQLDSLSDLISFGVAPASLAFAVGMRGGWDALVLLYFVACGVGRLARYNATCADLSDETGKVRYFEGTPIPTSLLLVAVLSVLTAYGYTLDRLPLGVWTLGPMQLHPLVLMYAVSGSAMISKTLRVPKI
ncbi:MAG TPA: CDP-alcohol phosphatidyltransferase family protein [Polyangiaceae bacterium]|nr:CDP-alcohol phosphatidyltransferase family protein [Polyangiaceae bacterium]HNZ21798.1 CDP-alcohol phosphatidyltransferase family protein [Polyangiaceae bacterium]HOD23478.1 CDP-alcohol phosphatidyltransferase family protein [Polyangiaceae bacterium]HOE50707.1 CDP-alcohol phosphatidyltransferase family protein [Polyangiaceae bacterium]HOG99641.1 CDP-alcohol phosphatidyltransferase family protein [Polyangiaceae bacterium]